MFSLHAVILHFEVSVQILNVDTFLFVVELLCLCSLAGGWAAVEQADKSDRSYPPNAGIEKCEQHTINFKQRMVQWPDIFQRQDLGKSLKILQYKRRTKTKNISSIFLF